MILRTLVLGILTLTLSACNISGSGQKGPFNAGSNVTVSQLNSQALPIASTTLADQISGSQGGYSVDEIPWDGWTDVSVTGTYFDEFNGTNGTESLTLRAITRKDKRFDTANVHLFSHLAAARIQQRIANGQTLNQAFKSTQQEMKDFFGFQRVSQSYQRGVEQLSLLAGTGSYRKDNANLLLFTGSFLATDGNAASLQLLTDDFADDAQFNGVGAGVFNAIAIKGGANGLLTTLSNNLKSRGTRNPPNNGDMISLPKWVVLDAGDVTPPVIFVLGDDPVEIEVGTTYLDAGATATDDVDEVVTVIAVDDSDMIDTSEAGTYTVTYSATDSSDNTATATRTVIVTAVDDNVAPVITLNGQETIEVVVGTPYIDEGATAFDAVDGEVAATAINDSDIIDTSVPFTHTITYRATDVAGNSSLATRTVIVVEAPDNTAPMLELLGDNPDTIEVDTGEVPAPYVDPGYTATDDRDEVVNVIVDGLETIDRSVLGSSYTITYTASDVAGNTTILTRTVNVADTTPPVIRLTGDNPHTITVDTNEVPAPYQDLGATVTDNYDDEISYSVDLSAVDTSTVGTYTLTYTASDSSDNDAISVEREVIVNPAPNEAPVVDVGTDVSVLINTGITLTGSATDADGTIVSYSWTDQSGTELATTASFEFVSSTLGVHTLKLTVIDDDGATSTDSVDVTVTLPASYQIELFSDITEIPRNFDPALFVQGLLSQAFVIDGNGNPVAEPALTVDSSHVNLAEAGEYSAVYSYTDPYERTVTKQVTVIVVNYAPVAQGQSISVDEDSNDNSITLMGTDANTGDTLTYTVTQPTNGVLSGTPPNVTYTPNTDYSGSDSFTFTVSDGVESDTASVNITVIDINDLPSADAGTDTTTEVNQSVTIVGSGTDTDGTIAAYSWTENGTELATTASFSYTPNTVGSHTLTLTVTDNDGATATDTVVVEATEVPNEEPTANAGADTSVEVNQSVTITGSGTDTDGTIVAYSWAENATVLATSASFSYTPTTVGSHTLTLTVTDNDGDTATDTVVVTATEPPNMPPIADAGPDIRVEIGQSVTMTGTGSDADGTIVSYSWTSETGFEYSTSPTFIFSRESVGTSILTFTVVDNDGDSTSDTVEVEVFTTDSTPPEIKLIGDNPQTVYLDASGLTSYQDPGATAIDVDDSSPCCEVQVVGTVDITQLGTYTLTYYAVDSSENIASEVRTVNVVVPPVAGYSCPATIATESSFNDVFVTNATADTPWTLTSGSISVQDIEDAFNAARAKDANSVQGQKLKMPEQTVWDAFTDSEKALYLINSERCARGIRPYEGISPEVVVSPAQTYAQYLADNDVFSHTADGRDPWQRLTEDAGVIVGTNADFFGRAENLAFVSSGSTGTHPTIYEPVARSIYGYLYDDKDDTTDPNTGIASYGHRAFVLATGLDENSGEPNKEGLIGIGKAELQTTQDSNGNTFNVTKVYSVMNGFDPNENWDMSNIQFVDLLETESCLAGYTGSTETNADGSTSYVCSIDAVETNPISGRVTSITGAELSGVSVGVLQNGVLLNETTSTASDGGFDLDLAPDSEFTLTFTAAGYANQVQRVKTPVDGQSINLDVSLIPRGDVQTISETLPVLYGQDGSAVDLTGNSFVDSDGNEVSLSDGVNVTITPVDVSTPAGVAAFPGDFTGIAQGTAAPIISYGTVEYHFTRASDGAVLQLAGNQTAQILIPIYTTTHQDGTPISVGDIIPLWSLNEDTGIWLQEGTGTVINFPDSPTGFAMDASVSHFSWWNSDAFMAVANAVVTVTAPEAGTALIKGRINENIGGWRANTVDTVITVGSSTGLLPIPSNTEVCFWTEISFTSGNTATTPESCVSAATGTTVEVNLQVAGGELGLTSSPDTEISTYVNVAPLQIKLQPTTSESAVTYSVLSGQLPVGVTLSSINATSAVISGVPTEAGVFNPVIQGVDSDGNTATVSLSYTVIDGVQPPVLRSGFLYTDDGVGFSPSERLDFVQNYSNEFLTDEFIPFGLVAEVNNVSSWSISNIRASQALFVGDEVGGGPVQLSGQGISISASTGLLSVNWDQVTSPDYEGGDYILKFTLQASNSGGSDFIEVEISREDNDVVVGEELIIVFNQNPVSVRVGSDPGTFFFESLPLGIIDGVYDSNENRIASGGAVDCNSNDVDLNTIGTYEMNCSYADEVLGYTESILTVNVTPIPDE